METQQTLKRTRGGVQYQIVGLHDCVRKAIDRIYDFYPPMGYGTTTLQEPRPTGDASLWEAVVWRADSCD